MRMKTSIIGALLTIATIVGVHARAAQQPAPAAPTVPPAPTAPSARVATASTIGIEGQVVFRHRKSEPVQAVPVDDKAPVVVRIADSTPDGEFVLYDVRFIAQYAGEFDLRDYLRRPDGSPLTDAEALPITVGKLLPEAHQGELIETEGSGAPRLGGYRIALIVIGMLWLIPPTWWVIRRLTRSAPPPPPQPAQPATLADQLRPLVEAAIAGTLSTSERAQLELLLLAYWRERLGLASHEVDHVGAIQRLREHPEAGELLVLLERWLHRPPRQDEVVDVAAVLERYRKARPIDVPSLQGAGA
jgi:hypothetical protein